MTLAQRCGAGEGRADRLGRARTLRGCVCASCPRTSSRAISTQNGLPYHGASACSGSRGPVCNCSTASWATSSPFSACPCCKCSARCGSAECFAGVTRYAEVIGDPIAQSKSPVIHGFWIEKLGLDANYRATSRRAGESLATISLSGERTRTGADATSPCRTSRRSIAHARPAGSAGQAIGAVNTVHWAPDGALVGTQYRRGRLSRTFARTAAKPALFPHGARARDGRRRARHRCRPGRRGFHAGLAGRNPDKARAMLDELAKGEHHAAPLAHFAEATDFAFDDRDGCCDLIVNASPLGMRGQPPLAFDWSHAPPGSIAYDIVTDPVETDFLTGRAQSGLRNDRRPVHADRTGRRGLRILLRRRGTTPIRCGTA